MVAQLQQPGYQAFLRYACPAWHPGATAPPGDNIELCPRAVLGTYDDHDYGVNNLNRRLPSKHLYKQVRGQGRAQGQGAGGLRGGSGDEEAPSACLSRLAPPHPTPHFLAPTGLLGRAGRAA